MLYAAETLAVAAAGLTVGYLLVDMAGNLAVLVELLGKALHRLDSLIELARQPGAEAPVGTAA